MNDWYIWFQTGIEHILDFDGYDHLLFICLLSLTFPFKEWKKLFLLITAFTLGHSVTLALSTLNIINVKQDYIELLIILTILITAVSSLVQKQNTAKRVMIFYLIICCFGLIHGMGFSYFLRSMLSKDDNIIAPLFFFNAGLEAGQIIVVSVMVLLSLLFDKISENALKYFKHAITFSVLFVSLGLLVSRTINIINT